MAQNDSDDRAGLRGYVQFNKYTYMHRYTHTHVDTYIHTYIHTYTHTYIQIYKLRECVPSVAPDQRFS